MKKSKAILFIALVILIAACKPSVPLPPTDVSLDSIARNTLISYFADLNNAEYETAALQYGGSYEVLQGYNPEITPTDKIALLQAGCERNGLMCMQVMTAKQESVENGLTYRYKVSFRAPDGNEFVLGPCCGADETEMPPVRYFEVTVICDEENICLVMDLPPYVP